MKNSLNIKSFFKVFILTIIFVAFLSVLSIVNAATKQLIVGQKITIDASDIGIETEWGEIKQIQISGKNTNAVSAKTTGKKSKSSDSRLNLVVKAEQVGQCQVKVTYKKDLWSSSETKVYNFNVVNKSISSISARITSTYKNVLKPGETISKDGLIITANYNDGTSETLNADKYSISPNVAPNITGKVSIAVTLKSNTKIKTSYTVHVNGTKQVDIKQPEKKQNELNNEETISNNKNSETNNIIYTNKLKIGEVLKFTATSWNLYSKKVMDSKIGYLLNNDTVSIEEKDGNWLKVRINSSNNNVNGKELYMYYGSTANKYFTVVSETNTEAEKVNPEGQIPTETNALVLEDITNIILNLITEILSAILVNII